MVAGIVPTGRTSVLTYRDNPAPPSQIARDLNVAYLGECSVLKAEGRVQVWFSLLEAGSGRQLWAEPFDAELVGAGGVIDMLSDIAQRVVRGVGVRLTPEEEVRMAAVPTESLTAYELYMIGRNRLEQYSAEKIRESMGYFEAAIEEDSTFALAFAGLADAFAVLPMYDLTVDLVDVSEQARAAVTRAYELDPSRGEVHTSMALFLWWFEWDWAGAERHLVEPLRLNPGYGFTRICYASLLSVLGRVEEAVGEARLVLAMDPRSSGVIWAVGDRFRQAGHVQEARDLYERAIRIEPPVPWALYNLASSFAFEEPRDPARAAELMTSFLSVFGYSNVQRIAILAEALGGEPRDPAEVTGVLDDVVARTILDRADIVNLYARFAPRAVFFDVLDEAVRGMHMWLPWIPVIVNLNEPEIMNDPRWEAFMTRIGHPGLGPW
jgi:tetratricopeptide (TPR) repeat protein